MSSLSTAASSPAAGVHGAVRAVAAVDLGATSGRVMIGRVGDGAVTPMLEVRRGVELFVAGVAPSVGVGPTIGFDGAVGVTARAGLNVKLRRTRVTGISLRLEAGADFVDDDPPVGFAGGVLLGVAWMRPAHALESIEVFAGEC